MATTVLLISYNHPISAERIERMRNGYVTINISILLYSTKYCSQSDYLQCGNVHEKCTIVEDLFFKESLYK
jgi:hypothetical protein